MRAWTAVEILLPKNKLLRKYRLPIGRKTTEYTARFAASTLSRVDWGHRLQLAKAMRTVLSRNASKCLGLGM